MINKHKPEVKFGLSAEKRFAAILHAYGHEVKVMPRQSKYDLLVDKVYRVEVKCALYDERRGNALVNFHRHGVLCETDVDFYLLRIENIPGFKSAISLLFKAPINRLTLKITLRSMISLYGDNFRQYVQFRGKKVRPKKPKTEAVAA